jgi:hypothetical protein
MPMSEIDFKLQKEQVEGGIRETKLDGYRADLEKERLVTQRKWVEVEIAQEELTHANLRLDTAREKTTQLNLRLQMARIEAQVLEVDLDMNQHQLTAKSMERELQFGLLTEKLRGMDLRLSEARQDNENLRLELSARGFSALPGSFSLKQILEVDV